MAALNFDSHGQIVHNIYVFTNLLENTHAYASKHTALLIPFSTNFLKHPFIKNDLHSSLHLCFPNFKRVKMNHLLVDS